jgi:lambda family phage portal protein
MNYLRNLASAFVGKPMAVLPSSGYNAARMGRRTMHIGTSDRGISSLAIADGPMLTRRTRKTVMDNPLAANGVNSFISEVIGTGIRPHSRHKDATTRELIEREFSLWVPQASAARRLGPDGKPDSMYSFWVQQQLVARNVIEAGEAFARFRFRYAKDLSDSGLRVPLQIDLIEPEQLAFWRNSADMASPENVVRASIEFNSIRERVAYHFYKEHPGDATIWDDSWQVARVPAGEVLHIMEFLRGNQIRGITALAPILIQLADLDGYDDAERLRQKLGAYMFGWRKTLTPDDPQIPGITGTVGNDQAPEGAAYAEAQPGTLTMLDTAAGEEFGFYQHPGVGGTYEAYMRVQRQTIATILRVTYDMLTGDNSSTTFMNARVRLLTLRRMWEQFQKSVVEHQFCRPVWRAWLDAAALAGRINASDYRKNPEEYLNVEWSGQPWDWVDPVKDITAVRMEMEACLTSREAEVAKRGRRVEEVDSEIDRDQEREKQLGIQPVYGSQPRGIDDVENQTAIQEAAPAPQPKKAA